jgi:D-glycero-alpha-D-manno-heptose-7-phosphate kinase
MNGRTRAQAFVDGLPKAPSHNEETKQDKKITRKLPPEPPQPSGTVSRSPYLYTLAETATLGQCTTGRCYIFPSESSPPKDGALWTSVRSTDKTCEPPPNISLSEPMIIARTPLRISLGGGGSDLPSYYERFGGAFISAAIDKYIYIAINNTFTNEYTIRYSSQERVSGPDEIRHPIVREAIKLHKLAPTEIVSLADIPAGTGLGSSGSFTVCLLRAIYAYKRELVTTASLAEEACHIEMDLLREPVGKQDQYIAAYGGVSYFEIDKTGQVAVSPLALTNQGLHDLEDHLMLFFTGYSRSAATLLADQKTKSETGDHEMIKELQFVVELGHEIRKVLLAGQNREFARLMREHWLRKRGRSSGISNDKIDRWYDVAMANGALGGKLVGAGGGGFLLFYADDVKGVRAAMAQEGLEEVRFKFDFDGSTVLMRE